MRIVRRLLLAVVVVALLYVGWRFPTENSQPIRVHYVFGSIEEVPVWAALVVSFLLGAGVAGLLAFFKVTRQGLETRRYRKAARDLESEVHQLRNLPLSAEEAPSEPRGELRRLTGLGLAFGPGLLQLLGQARKSSFQCPVAALQLGGHLIERSKCLSQLARFERL